MTMRWHKFRFYEPLVEDRQGRGEHESAGGGLGGLCCNGCAQGGQIFIGCYCIRWQISITTPVSS